MHCTVSYITVCAGMVCTVCIVLYSIVYGICIMHNSIYQYVRLCDDDMRLNEAKRI